MVVESAAIACLVHSRIRYTMYGHVEDFFGEQIRTMYVPCRPQWVAKQNNAGQGTPCGDLFISAQLLSQASKTSKGLLFSNHGTAAPRTPFGSIQQGSRRSARRIPSSAIPKMVWLGLTHVYAKARAPVLIILPRSPERKRCPCSGSTIRRSCIATEGGGWMWSLVRATRSTLHYSVLCRARSG